MTTLNASNLFLDDVRRLPLRTAVKWLIYNIVFRTLTEIEHKKFCKSALTFGTIFQQVKFMKD